MNIRSRLKKLIPNPNLKINNATILERVGKFTSPIIYALAWLILLWLANQWLPKEVVSNDNFLILYTIVFLFLLISKSPLWSIGHEKFGIKGDSRSRIVNFHGADFWFDLFADNPELLKNKEVQEFIKSLVEKGSQK